MNVRFETLHGTRSGKDEWLTPPHIVRSLSEFDLDPCSPVNRPWDTARSHYTVEDNGLIKEWFGRVWCNPPYGRETGKWLEKCAMHGNAIAIVFARTETSMFFNYVWGVADAVLFLKGRLQFYHVDGSCVGSNAGAPSVLVGYGRENAKVLESCGLPGMFIDLKRL